MNKFMLVNLRTHEMDHLNKLSKTESKRNRSNLSKSFMNLNCQNLDTHILATVISITMNLPNSNKTGF